MRNKAWMVGCTILLAAAAASAGETDVFTSKDLGFSIEYPTGWKEGTIRGETILVSFSGGTIARTLQVISDKGGEQEGMARLDKLGNLLRQKERKAEWKTVNGRRAYVQLAEWKNIMGVNVAVRMMVPLKDRYYLVLGHCPLKEFEKLGPTLEKCVLSFKVTKE